MSYREVSVIEIVEMLRLWLQGLGLREVARLSGTDRKTVRRCVDRARACGVDRDGGECLNRPGRFIGSRTRAVAIRSKIQNPRVEAKVLGELQRNQLPRRVSCQADSNTNIRRILRHL
jgi:hypothetical protein